PKADSLKASTDRIGVKEAEENLMSQLNKYLTAFHKGNADIAINYIYPDIFAYQKRHYPAEEVSISALKDDMRRMVSKMNETMSSKGFKVSIEAGEITSRKDLGRDKIYSIETYVKSKR